MAIGSETKYYVDANGNYAGGFAGTVTILDDKNKVIQQGYEPVIPQGLIEVENAPSHALQKWDFVNSQWLPLSDFNLNEPTPEPIEL